MFGWFRKEVTRTRYISVCPDCNCNFEAADADWVKSCMKNHYCLSTSYFTDTDIKPLPIDLRESPRYNNVRNADEFNMDTGTYLAQPRNVMNAEQHIKEKAPTVAEILERAKADLKSLRGTGPVHWDTFFANFEKLIDVVENLTYITSADDERALGKNSGSKETTSSLTNDQNILSLLVKAEKVIDDSVTMEPAHKVEAYRTLAKTRSELEKNHDLSPKVKPQLSMQNPMDLPELIELGAFLGDMLMQLRYTAQATAINNEINSLQELYRKTI